MFVCNGIAYPIDVYLSPCEDDPEAWIVRVSMYGWTYAGAFVYGWTDGYLVTPD